MKHKPVLPKEHPLTNRSGWYTTHDIMELFGWKRGLIKNWIEQEFIKPAGWTEDARGKISFFAGYQLYTIKLFSYLLKMGFQRKYASVWAKRIENDIFKSGNLNVDKITFAVFEISYHQVLRVSFFEDPEGINIDWKDNSNDFLVVNFKRIIDEVDAVT